MTSFEEEQSVPAWPGLFLAFSAVALAAEQGFAQVDHELEFFGTCAACAG